MGPCITMLQHEEMAGQLVWRYRCSLSVACACPYHNSTTAMGHSADVNKLLAKPLPAMCPIEGKPSSPKFNTSAKVSIGQLKSGMPSEWLISHHLSGEETWWRGPGLAWLHVDCGCVACCLYCQILCNAIGGGLCWWTCLQLSCQLHAPSKLVASVELCCMKGTSHFRVSIYCDHARAHLCNNHALSSISWYVSPGR